MTDKTEDRIVKIERGCSCGACDQPILSNDMLWLISELRKERAIRMAAEKLITALHDVNQYFSCPRCAAHWFVALFPHTSDLLKCKFCHWVGPRSAGERDRFFKEYYALKGE